MTDLIVLRHLVYDELLAACRPASYIEAQNIIANNQLANPHDVRSVRKALQSFFLLKVCDDPDDIAAFLYKRFSDAIFTVPGFYMKGELPFINCGPQSALNRYFYSNGLIAGCYVYPLNRAGEFLLSSSRFGGPSAVNPRGKTLVH